MFVAGRGAKSEKMPSPPLLEMVAGTGHQIFDAKDVGKDVVAVISDERIAVDENGRKRTDGEDEEKGGFEFACGKICPGEGGKAADDDFGNDACSVDEKSLRSRKSPTVGRIRKESWHEDDESDAYAADTAVEMNGCKGMGGFVGDFQDDDGDEIFDETCP